MNPYKNVISTHIVEMFWVSIVSVLKHLRPTISFMILHFEQIVFNLDPGGTHRPWSHATLPGERLPKLLRTFQEEKTILYAR